MGKPAAYCPFNSIRDGLHQICVAELNPAPTRKGWEWFYDKELQCIRIEKYDPFADALLPFDFSGSGGFRWGGIKLTEFHPKCVALPARVLDSQYSTDMLRGSDLPTRKYQYVSPTSSKSPGNIPGKYDTIQSVEYVTSDRSRKVRDAVEKICDICGAQATSATAKETLRSKCDAVLKLRPSEVPFEPFAIARKKRPFSETLEEKEEHVDFISIPTYALMGLIMGSGVTIAVRQVRGSASAVAEGRQRPLLA